jgi:endoglucanase
MKRRIAALLLAMSLAIGIVPTQAAAPEPTQAVPVNAVNTTISAQDFVNSIGAGWNLGNTFDAASGSGHGGGFSWLGGGRYADTSVADMEAAWLGGGTSVLTTRAFLQSLHAAGFRAVRIPVTWHKAAGSAPTYTIRTDWMNRVKEVVQWAYELDMHIILNTHHENSFIGLTNANFARSERRLARLWEQIAHEFRDYSERLIFAGLNEPRASVEYSGPGNWNEWGGGIPETRANLNRLNQVFVNTVRASGGNNAHRFLLVPTHAASATDEAFNGFRMPQDSANDRMLLAVHTYSPFAWAHNGNGQYTGPAGIRSDLDRVADYAQRFGVPVILSEWGSIENGQTVNRTQRVEHARDYVSYARQLGMATFWWDNHAWEGNSSGGFDHTFGIMNRRTNAPQYPDIVAAIMEGMQTQPGSSDAPTVPETALQVRLMAMGGGGWPAFTGENTVIRGNGTHTVTLNVGGSANLATLNIENVGDIHARFHPATIAITALTINGGSIGHTHNPASNLSYVNEAGLRVVDTVFWNQWWEGGQILTTGVRRNPEGHFSLTDNAAMNSVSVTFTVSGAANCPTCNAAVCTCTGAAVGRLTCTRDSACRIVNCGVCAAIALPARVVRTVTVSVCIGCGEEKPFMLTTFIERGEIARQRRISVKRDGEQCSHEYMRV